METYASGGLKDLIFNAAVDMMIFGHRFYAGVQFNLRSPFTSLKSAGDSGTNWYKDKMNPKGRTGTEKNYYDNANPFVDFEMSGKWKYHFRLIFAFVLVRPILLESGIHNCGMLI